MSWLRHWYLHLEIWWFLCWRQRQTRLLYPLLHMRVQGEHDFKSSYWERYNICPHIEGRILSHRVGQYLWITSGSVVKREHHRSQKSYYHERLILVNWKPSFTIRYAFLLIECNKLDSLNTSVQSEGGALVTECGPVGRGYLKSTWVVVNSHGTMSA